MKGRSNRCIYYRATYKPAGFYPRRFLVYSLMRETHGGTGWYHGIVAATDRPIYLHEADVTEILDVTP